MPKSTGTKHKESVAASSKSRTTSAKSKPKVSNQLEIPLVGTLSAGKKPRQVLKPSPKVSGSMYVNLAICLDNSDDADLIRGKTYRILHDRRAAADGYLRIVDESGGDYLYAIDRFLVVKKRVTSRIAEKLFS